jgi:hypothetical protein
MASRAIVFLSLLAFTSTAYGGFGMTARILSPVKITTNQGQATSEIHVELTWKNILKKAATYKADDLPRFVLLDGSGKELDRFVVETKPEQGETQFTPETKEILLQPNEHLQWKVKVWIRGLAMEPGKRYQLGDRGDYLEENVPFVPTVSDERWRVRLTAYEQVVRITGEGVDQCATVFDINCSTGEAAALTILPKPVESVSVTPLLQWTGNAPFPQPYTGEPRMTSVKRAKNGISVLTFPWHEGECRELKQQLLPLADANFDYGPHTFIACGWDKATGVEAPCSAIRGEPSDGFLTIYATPQPGWPGSGYFSDDGYLVGICEHRAPSEHANRQGVYVDVKQLRAALEEVAYKYPAPAEEQ